MSNNKAREVNNSIIKQLLDETTPEELAKIDTEMTNNKQQTEMNKEFIPYELALELKQLGFAEPCFAFYDESLYFPNNENQYGTFCNQKLDASSCSAPTYSQAFRWFRENYNIDISINTVYSKYNENTSKKYGGVIDNESVFTNVGFHDTYEEAEIVCLKKLIEIVKEVTNDKQ
jgi:hypothetical protein